MNSHLFTDVPWALDQERGCVRSFCLSTQVDLRLIIVEIKFWAMLGNKGTKLECADNKHQRAQDRTLRDTLRKQTEMSACQWI